ncbi:MAG: hypothetical protein GY854_08555 [Deltaproteobacteria bacterium]|nr:hypothetical protein [Deltaproteobacteria bacterium]
MSVALKALCEVAETMFEVSIERTGPVFSFDPSVAAFGATVSLLRDESSWDMALFGTEEGCKNLTRAAYAMEPDEDPSDGDVVDALGELVNMVSGALKRNLGSGSHQKLDISIPIVLLGDDCRSYGTREISLHAQAITSPVFEGELYFVWSERTRKNLIREIAATLKDAKAEDTWSLGQALLLFQEFEEFLPELTADAIRDVIDECQALIVDVINEQTGNEEAVLHAVETTVSSLATALEPDQSGPAGMKQLALVSPANHLASLLEQRPRESLSQDQDGEPVTVERDEEDLELFADFLEESEEWVDSCDRVLMEVEQSGANEEQIGTLFRTFHSIKGLAGQFELEDIATMTHATEDVLSSVRSGTFQLKGPVLDVVFESTGLLRKLLGQVRQALEKSVEFSRSPEAPKHVERLRAINRGEMPSQEIAPQFAKASEAATAEPSGAAPSEDRKLKETIKVDVELLGAFEELVKKLDSVAATVASSEETRSVAPVDVAEAFDSLAGLVGELQDIGIQLRMVEVRPLFQKMSRMVRDLSKKTDKLVKLAVSGADTKVGRKMVEKLGAPLMHMIRNSVDHGIEKAEQRKELGKPVLGTVSLGAHWENKDVVVEVRDNGKGLDRTAILSKAVEQGLVENGESMSDEEIFKLIFHPGFSTAQKVTAISGRGVGMDVVRKDIESLDGRIEIQSELHKGSTFRIVLPSR